MMNANSVKDRLIEASGNIKTKLGICCHKRCFHRAVADIVFPQINLKRCLCEKHLIEFQKMELKGYIQKESEK